MPKKRRTRLEILGLMRVDCPANIHAIIQKRVEPFRKLHLDAPHGMGYKSLPTRIDSCITDAYLQGVLDGYGCAANNPELASIIRDAIDAGVQREGGHD